MEIRTYIQGGNPVRVSTKMHYDFAFKDKVIEDPKMPQRIVNSSSSNASGPQTPARDSSNVVGTASEVPAQPTLVHVNQGVSQGLLMHQVAPVYPDSARRNRIQGTVVLEAIIGKDGRIRDLRTISSPSTELAQAAVGAVQQWRYHPYMLKGEPIDVETTVNVHFTLH